MKPTVTILNGTDHQFTVQTLKKAAGKAKGKALATIQSLIRGLEPTTPPAARSRQAQGEIAMKKRTHKGKATSRRKVARKRKSNPTAVATAPRRHSKARAYFHKAKSRVKAAVAKFDIGSIAMEAAAFTGGMLLASAAERQAEKFLPDMNPMVRSVGAGAVVAAAAWFLGQKLGKKDLAKGLMVGAVAETIRTIGRTVAPSVFAGTEGGLAGWDPYTGQYAGGLYEPGAQLEYVQAVGV